MRFLPLLISSTLSLFAETYIINGANIGYIEQHNNAQLSHKSIVLTEKFSQLKLNLPADFVIDTTNDKNSIQLEADEKIIDDIRVYVKQNKLYIHASKKIKTSLPIHVSIQSKENVEDIHTKGTTSIILKGSNQARLHLDTQGVSKIKVSTGDIKNLEINTKGNYHINLLQVQTKNASIQAKGIGKIKLNVSENLDVQLSNIAKVYYQGQPKIIQSLKGLSQLEKR